MERTKVVRGLRIAWSVWWGIVCALLIVLWVRSYSLMEVVSRGLVYFYRLNLGGPVLNRYTIAKASHVEPRFKWSITSCSSMARVPRVSYGAAPVAAS